MILIVDRQRAAARAISEIFHYMGNLSYYCTPTELLSELDSRYSAVLFSRPELFDYESALSGVRNMPFDIGCFAISGGGEKLLGFDRVFEENALSSTVYSGINEALAEKMRPPLGEYILSGIDASCERSSVLYFGRRVLLTRTERMILRYLIRSHPTPMTPRDILDRAFKPSRKPEPSAIRTHIFAINKKFAAVGCERLIGYTGSGYTVLTPALIGARRASLV